MSSDKQRNTSWLISYGDTVTLLICLLITIVVVLQGQSDKSIEWLASEVQVITDLLKINDNYSDTTKVKIVDGASNFKILLTGLFPPCGYEIKNKMKPLINNLADDLLKQRQKLDTIFPSVQNKIKDLRDFNLIIDIIIEGHTDSILFNCSTPGIINNWQLSATRAKTVFDEFINVSKEKYKQYQKDISIRGYADTRPFRKKENLAENRRIEITFNAYLEPLIKKNKNDQLDSLVSLDDI